MNNAVASISLPAGGLAQRSLDASDDFDAPGVGRYCPMRLLAAFALLMSGHGRCINTTMMLGDREYAMWQLAGAHTLDDAELREVAARLFAYFDDQRAGPAVGLKP
jgi:hypothetical protein